ncbi:hypothetical protein SeMB42_g07721, partial [Synchytrium endobioticum]
TEQVLLPSSQAEATMFIKNLIVVCVVVWSMLITYVHGCRQYDAVKGKDNVFAFNSKLTRDNCIKVKGTLTGSDSSLQCASPNGDFAAFHSKWATITQYLTEASCGGLLTPIVGSPNYEVGGTA